MGRDGRTDTISITGPDGSKLTLADLPSPTTRRWVMSRKAKIIAAVEGGLLTFQDACRRYNLTLEEYRCWEVALHHVPAREARPAHRPGNRGNREILHASARP